MSVTGRRRVARRALSALVGTALVAAGLAATAPPAGAADTVTTLGLTSFGDVVVDDAHQQVFVSGGPSASSVEVRGFDGTLKATVTGQTGASGLALSPDGSAVYAALDGAGAVSRISTTTLAETARYAIGRSTCVSSLVFAGTRLFVGYGCTTSAAIAELDLAAATPALGTALTGAWGGPVHLSADAAGSRLVAVDDGQATSTLRSYDLTANPPTAVTVSTATTPGDTCHDVAVEPTAGDAVLACEAPAWSHVALKATDLSASFTYSTGPWPVAVAVTDTAVAAATYGGSAPDISLFDRHAASASRAISVGPDRVAAGGLAFAANGTLFAVSAPTTGSLRLHAFPLPFATTSTLTLSGPATATRTAALTLTGSLTGTTAIPAGATVTVSKTDLAGSHTLASVTTGAAGDFTVHDTPQVGGPNTYRVAYAGDARHAPATASAVVTVSRVTPLLQISTNASVYVYNGLATVTVHLGPTYTNRVVKIYAQPVNSTRVLIRSGVVNSAGNLVATRRVTIKTSFTAVYDGDFRTAARTVSKPVTSQILLGETMSKYYATSGGYYLYRTTVNPTLTAKATPDKSGQCVRFVAQRYSAGAWRPWATSLCSIHFGTASSAVAFLAGSHPRGYKFRMRAEFPGDSLGRNAATSGAWKYFRFP